MTTTEINFPAVAIEPAYFKTGENFIECEENKAIVNLENNHTYSIVSNRYKLQKHEEAIAAVEEALEEGGLTDYERKVYMNNDGGLISVYWTFPKSKHAVEVGDIICPRIKMVNSYNRGRSFVVEITGLRLVCSNGLTRGFKLARYCKKHTISLDMEKMKRILVSGIKNFKKQVDHWAEWTKIGVDQPLFDKVRNVLTEKDFGEVLVLSEIGSGENLKPYVNEDNEITAQSNITKWIFYNILTQYITHHVSSQRKQLKYSKQIGNVFK
ncbi:MAG: DUF945 domain-containing protein [PVC group bacterium]|nr:DUF945 domain-containing protein [PVC group bacterium]